MDEKISEACQILQIIDSRINDLDSNITRALAMAGSFAALISLSVKFDRWTEALFIYFDVASMIFYLAALWTRRRLNREVSSPIFYENIARRSKEEFMIFFHDLDQANYLKNLEEEIYRGSRSLVIKERWFNLGLVFLVLSLLCWIVVNIWSLF